MHAPNEIVSDHCQLKENIRLNLIKYLHWCSYQSIVFHFPKNFMIALHLGDSIWLMRTVFSYCNARRVFIHILLACTAVTLLPSNSRKRHWFGTIGFCQYLAFVFCLEWLKIQANNQTVYICLFLAAKRRCLTKHNNNNNNVGFFFLWYSNLLCAWNRRLFFWNSI